MDLYFAYLSGTVENIYMHRGETYEDNRHFYRFLFVNAETDDKARKIIENEIDQIQKNRGEVTLEYLVQIDKIISGKPESTQLFIP